MTFPEPYRARPARRDDLEALVRLSEARDLADVGSVGQSRDEILEDWAAPFVDLERDTVVVELDGGDLAAYGVVISLDPAVQVRAVGRVHPDHAGRGIGSALVDGFEHRASDRIGRGERSPLRIDVSDADAAVASLLRARGYRHVRSSWMMQRSLPADGLQRPDPDGISFRSATIDDEPAMHAVDQASFTEHFGFEPLPFEDWRGWVHDSPGYDPALSILAVADDEPVGVSLNFGSDDGVGWVGDLAVLPGFRRRGIASALLVRSFDGLAAAGHHEVRLGVDTENTTGATFLYERVGMGVLRGYHVYERWLDGAYAEAPPEEEPT